MHCKIRKLHGLTAFLAPYTLVFYLMPKTPQQPLLNETKKLSIVYHKNQGNYLHTIAMVH